MFLNFLRSGLLEIVGSLPVGAIYKLLRLTGETKSSWILRPLKGTLTFASVLDPKGESALFELDRLLWYSRSLIIGG